MTYEEWVKKYIDKDYVNNSNIEDIIKEELKKKNKTKTTTKAEPKTTKTTRISTPYNPKMDIIIPNWLVEQV